MAHVPLALAPRGAVGGGRDTDPAGLARQGKWLPQLRNVPGSSQILIEYFWFPRFNPPFIGFINQNAKRS